MQSGEGNPQDDAPGEGRGQEKVPLKTMSLTEEQNLGAKQPAQQMPAIRITPALNKFLTPPRSLSIAKRGTVLEHLGNYEQEFSPGSASQPSARTGASFAQSAVDQQAIAPQLRKRDATSSIDVGYSTSGGVAAKEDLSNSRSASGCELSKLCPPCPRSSKRRATKQREDAASQRSPVSEESASSDDDPHAALMARLARAAAGSAPSSGRIKFAHTPLCRYRCDLFLMSECSSDEMLLPMLATYLCAPFGLLGKSEFFVCTSRPVSSDIYQRLAEIPFCGDGISLIIVAFGWATAPLCKALEENAHPDSLKQGRMAEEVYELLETVTPRMAVFALWPVTYLRWDYAKIVVNIDRSKQRTAKSGRLETRTINGKEVNKIVFHDENEDSSLLSYLKNAEIVNFMRQTLCRYEPAFCKSPHSEKPPEGKFGICKFGEYCSPQ